MRFAMLNAPEKFGRQAGITVTSRHASKEALYLCSEQLGVAHAYCPTRGRWWEPPYGD